MRLVTGLLLAGLLAGCSFEEEETSQRVELSHDDPIEVVTQFVRFFYGQNDEATALLLADEKLKAKVQSDKSTPSRYPLIAAAVEDLEIKPLFAEIDFNSGKAAVRIKMTGMYRGELRSTEREFALTTLGEANQWYVTWL